MYGEEGGFALPPSGGEEKKNLHLNFSTLCLQYFPKFLFLSPM